MVKLGFKIFALATVIFFFTGAAVMMAITAVVPAAHVSPGVISVVYPLARENSKIRFERLFNNLSSGVLKQRIVFSELEANAYIYQAFGNKKNFPIKEPYISFIEDTARIRFDLSLEDSWKMLNNQLKGRTLDKNIKSVMNSSRPSRRISFTIDIGINWNRDYPELSVKKVYVGALPLPFNKFFNQFFYNANVKVKEAFGKSLNRGQFYIRDLRLENKLLTANLEAKATDEFVRREETIRMRADNPDMFNFFKRNPDRCKIACTGDEEDSVTNYVDTITPKVQLTDKDVSTAREILRKVEKKKRQPKPPVTENGFQ